MSAEDKAIRIPFNINRGNPEHEKVYAILEQQKNKNAFIREAILNYYAQSSESRCQIAIEDVREIVKEASEEIVDTLFRRLKEIKFVEEKPEESSEEGKKQIDFDDLKNLF